MAIVIWVASLSYSQSITINHDLVFGNVFPGVPRAVSPRTPGEAAEYHITGTADAEVTIDMTLPRYLHTTGATMQIIFSNSDMALDSSAVPDQRNPGQPNLNPWHTIIYRIGSTGILVWLGGSIVPAPAQKPGSYLESIVMTVTYTGN